MVLIDKSYDLLLLSNQDLLSFGGSIVDTLIGYRGVVIFRQAYEGLPNDFICFDLACTSESCHYYNKVEVERFGINAVCPVCGTEYELLSYGWPTKANTDSGESNPLYQYKTYFSGRYLSVENK